MELLHLVDLLLLEKLAVPHPALQKKVRASL
jgi:hypothetical protein